MAYTKQTWATGDTITAAKLNHIEDGIEDAGGSGFDLVVRFDGATPWSGCDPTFVSGLSPADLYDKMAVDGEPILIMAYGFYSSALPYAGCAPYLCTANTTSTPDTVVFAHSAWNNWFMRYDSNGVSVWYD